MALPALYLATPAISTNVERNERRRQTDRRHRSQERRRQTARAPENERRTSNEERRSGLDRRVLWDGEAPRRIPLERHLAPAPSPSRIGTLIDLYV